MTRTGSHSDPSRGASSVQLLWPQCPEEREPLVPGSCSVLSPVLCSVDHSQPQSYPSHAPSAATSHLLSPETKSTGPDNARQVQHNPGNTEGLTPGIPQPLAFPNRWAAAKCSFWCCFLRLWIISMKSMHLLRCLSILWSLPHETTGLQQSTRPGTNQVAHFWSRSNLDLPCFSQREEKTEGANNKDSPRKARLQHHFLSSHLISLLLPVFHAGLRTKGVTTAH